MHKIKGMQVKKPFQGIEIMVLNLFKLRENVDQDVKFYFFSQEYQN